MAAAETPAAGPSPCTACRATGSVISNLGGTPQTVQCPWCEGSGVFVPDHDAQAHHDTDQTASQEPSA